MTLSAQIPTFALLITVSACSIQHDVPEFSYPPSTLTGSVAEKPVLQPTRDLIVDSSEDENTYQEIVALLDARAYRLRQAVGTPSEP